VPINKQISSIIESSFDIRVYRFNQLSSVKSFERAAEAGGAWSVGKDKWDALIFEAKRDIRVYAIGIHGAKDDKPRDLTIGYKYII
jgi:hypothetical protein